MPQKGFDSFLQYGYMAAPGIMHLKSGAYLMGWLYQGPDIESSSDDEQNWQSASYNNAINRLGDGWMIHQIICRAPSNEYPSGDFDETTNELIDAERRIQFTEEGTHYETFPFLFLTYQPPMHQQSGMLAQIGRFMMGRTKEEGIDQEYRDLKYINEMTQSFEMSFSQTMDLRRLSIAHPDDDIPNDELLHAINMVVNNENHPCCLPDPPMDLDSWLARDCEDGEYFVYDGKYTTVLSVDQLPLKSSPNLLAEVEHLPMDLMWSSRFIIMDDHYSRNLIDSMRKKWMQKTLPFMARMLGKESSARVDHYAVQMVAETESEGALVEQGLVTHGHYTSTVVLRADDPDLLKRKEQMVMKLFERRGVKLRHETRNSMEAFIGSLPGHGRENVRKPFFHSLNFADLTPNSNDWSGSPVCPCPPPNFPEGSPPLIMASSVGTTPFRMNLHVDDVGHTLILGPTGAGKSTLLATIVSQFDRYPDSQIFVFDKGYSMLPLTMASRNAIHYDLGKLGTDEMGGLCPLAEIDNEADRAFAIELFDTLIQLQIERNNAERISATDRNLMREAINILAESTTRPEQRTMTNFLSTVQSNQVRTLLSYYRIGESVGGMCLDGSSNDIEYKDLVTFEIEDLLRFGDETVVPVLLFLFHQIEKRLKGAPSLLVIDEAWLALSKPVFADKIREWLKVFRKANCAVVLATQEVGDIAASPIISTLVESCPTKIYLANPEANTERSRKLYQDVFGLSDTQISLIANMTRKRQYYFVNPQGRRVFDLGLGPIALSFVGAGAKEDLKRVRELHGEYGETWPAYWLSERISSETGKLWLNMNNKRYGAKEVML